MRRWGLFCTLLFGVGVLSVLLCVPGAWVLRYQHAMPMYASDEFITSTCVYDEVHALECGEQGRGVVDIHRSKRRVAQLGPLGACIV